MIPKKKLQNNHIIEISKKTCFLKTFSSQKLRNHFFFFDFFSISSIKA